MIRTSVVALLIAASAVGAAGCGPRQVDVSAAEPTGAAVQLAVTNSLSQAVNIYVVSNGAETFLRQIGPNASETIPVRSVAAGSTVTLRAVPVDGRDNYTRQNVVLSGTYTWQLP